MIKVKIIKQVVSYKSVSTELSEFLDMIQMDLGFKVVNIFKNEEGFTVIYDNGQPVEKTDLSEVAKKLLGEYNE